MKAIKYIIEYLLGEENKDKADNVCYGKRCDNKCLVWVKQTDFFDEGIFMTPKSMPLIPLKTINNIPILFGESLITKENGQIIIHADLIASTFFLISRYEECVRRDVRDEHGRFIGKESLPYKAGFLNRPIVEEYGALLRQCLRDAGLDVKEPQPGFSHIYLTHDVDQIWTWDNYYRALRTVIRRCLKNEADKLLPVKSVYNYKKYDPVYTFPELLKWDGELKKVYAEKCQDIYFIMGCEKKTIYDTGYIANRDRTKRLLDYLQHSGANIGVHTSYTAASNMDLFKSEVKNIEDLGAEKITKVRNHYLASKEPEDFRYYIDAGMTDDFTMGYADVAGFRLGTCRPVRWIDPIKLELTSLMMHPMTVMECTLDGKNYMNITDEEEAFLTVRSLLSQIKKYNGEVVLLWHSPSVYDNKGSYQRSLYLRVLEQLKNENLIYQYKREQ